MNKQRLALPGWSHGAQPALAAAARAEALVRSARALVAAYPDCGRVADMFRNELVAPRCILTPDRRATTEHRSRHAAISWTSRGAISPGKSPNYIEYPERHHGFDSALPMRERQSIGGTRSGTGTTGGNAPAREHSAKELLAFLRNHL